MKKRLSYGVAALAVVAGLAGASRTKSESKTGYECEPGPAVSTTGMVSIVKKEVELCKVFQRCDPQELDHYYGGTVEDCMEYTTCVGRGNNLMVTKECVQSLRDANCSVHWYDLLFSPLCEPGGPVPPAELGERCDYGVCRPGTPNVSYIRCDAGLFCNRNKICKQTVPIGKPCKYDMEPGVAIDPCAEGSYCSYVAEKCVAYLPPGSPCEVEVTPRDKLDPCAYSTALPAACKGGVCAVATIFAPYRDLDESATCEAETVRCKYGLACVDGNCQPLQCDGATGNPCDQGTCADELVCPLTVERCEERGPKCDEETGECPPGLWCDDNTTTCQSP